MTRTQVLILAILGVLVCIVLGVAVTMIRGLLTSSGVPGVAEQPDVTASPIPTSAATWTPIPTSTFTPTPADTFTPTLTHTRVVVDTATPTPSQTPTPTPIQTVTPTPSGSGSGGGGGGGGGGGPGPTPAPTSRYPFKLVEEPLEYVTKNYFLVVLVKMTSGDELLPGYRMIGTSPTGLHFESEPSCDHLCRASGPKEEDRLVQEGNLVFEAPIYEVGTWSLILVDSQGQQAAEVLEIETLDPHKRRWFYCHFDHQ